MKHLLLLLLVSRPDDAHAEPLVSLVPTHAESAGREEAVASASAAPAGHEQITVSDPITSHSESGGGIVLCESRGKEEEATDGSSVESRGVDGQTGIRHTFFVVLSSISTHSNSSSKPTVFPRRLPLLSCCTQNNKRNCNHNNCTTTAAPKRQDESTHHTITLSPPKQPSFWGAFFFAS